MSSLSSELYMCMCMLFPLCIHTLYSELRVARADLEAMKKQAESTNTEYDRLAEEHQKLQVCNLQCTCT